MVQEGAQGVMTAAICAQRSGLTVRALRLYERLGLIRPDRSAKGWRFYGQADLQRLAAIAVLRSLGFGLRDIATLLAGSSNPRAIAPDLTPLLQARARAWEEDAARARRGLLQANAALEVVRGGHALSIEQLCTFMRSITMTEWPKTLEDAANALFTPEEQGTILARKLSMRDDPTHGQAAWAVLIGELRGLIGEGAPPESERAQALAIRWMALVRGFSGGDAAMESKTGAFWTQALAQDPEGRELPFSRAEWEFVGSAWKSSQAAASLT